MNPSWNQQAKQLYEQLCRGEITAPPAVMAKLHCRYVDNGNPFLKIAPFKVEEAYPKPKIVIFHDVMSDDEISTIKRIAHPRVSKQIKVDCVYYIIN